MSLREEAVRRAIEPVHIGDPPHDAWLAAHDAGCEAGVAQLADVVKEWAGDRMFTGGLLTPDQEMTNLNMEALVEALGG